MDYPEKKVMVNGTIKNGQSRDTGNRLMGQSRMDNLEKNGNTLMGQSRMDNPETLVMVNGTIKNGQSREKGNG